MQGQISIAAAFMVYSILGGAFPIGQFMAAELGRYEIWRHRRRLIVGSALYLFSFAPAIAMLMLVDWDLLLLPWILISVLIVEKAGLNQLNRLMPGKFQPTDEELREKYGEALRIDPGEITAILEDDFTRKLGFGQASKYKRPSFLKGEDLADEEGLKEAIEGYIERERRRTQDTGEK